MLYPPNSGKHWGFLKGDKQDLNRSNKYLALWIIIPVLIFVLYTLLDKKPESAATKKRPKTVCVGWTTVFPRSPYT